MTDYYKILNLRFGASDGEIRKHFRKLATFHHPDKNNGCEKSEEKFKIILDAYKVLSDKSKRFDYDIRYKHYFQSTQNEKDFHSQGRQKTGNNQKTKKSQNQGRQQKYNQPNQKPTSRTNINYGFWLILVIIALLLFYSYNKKNTTDSPKEILKTEKPQSRPQSGELEFYE